MVDKKVIKKETVATNMERAVGRRKTSAARVRLSLGKGVIIINDRPMEEFFPLKKWQMCVLAPLKIVGKEKQMDVTVKIAGGGVVSQALAVRHGLSRSLIKWNAEFRSILKAAGFLTRDQRSKERKKPGLHRARRGHQWRKR